MTERRAENPPPAPQLVFAAQLRELRRRTYAEPTEATLARKMGCSRSTVSAILNGRRFPSWPHTEAFVVGCEGNVRDWRERWLRAKRQIDESRQGAVAGTAAPLDTVAEAPLAEGLHAAAHTGLAVRWYRDNREFYGAAAERVHRARSEIRVTYTRRYPPTQYTTRASAEYFQAILEWAAEESDDERCVRRIIGVPEQGGVPDKDMLAWARRHHEDTSHLLNYEANVLRWMAPADGLNMALVDDNAVFLAFSGGSRQRLNGFSVEDPTFMSYFAGYFEQLWAALQPLSTYLEEIDGRRPDPRG
ncbi:helix-turn-helix transcriptional regulator [Streptomyces himalayensis]|uniref:Helix-turn-helix transcriptional regulator n=1 Tax=Streptomyces himalayensis subsp. himalayensis TaxID=2756131 RepID=A0A7W0ID94_9ACTN|nr:helix-turn-helix transcriptional regulator [Streptomyces himalayensis]MBA2951034.1 helix-turn-helix transcriptional regulator [Streptomyces himalayensis subsp. himalayensis]